MASQARFSTVRPSRRASPIWPLGPATGRLLAEMMTGETPFADPTPYAVERFG
jgi:hypothetical protein